MSIPASDKFELLNFRQESVPKTDGGEVRIDLYVHLPRNRRFVLFLLEGNPFGKRHLQMLKRHKTPELFCKFTDFERKCPEEPIPDTPHNRLTQQYQQNKEAFRAQHPELFETHTSAPISASTPTSLSEPMSSKQSFSATTETDRSRQTFQGDSSANTMNQVLSQHNQAKPEDLKKAIATELSEVYRQFLGAFPSKLSLKNTPLTELNQELMEVIAPEVERLREHLRKVPEYSQVMKISEGITAIAVLFCLAKGQISRSIFREVSYACLLMDMGLVGFSEDDFSFYYQDKELLSDEKKTALLQHPRHAYDLIQAGFKSLPDIVGQIVIGHHELHNSKGYPRKVRSEMLAPLVRIVAFAVDTYELMQKANLNERDLLLGDAIRHFRETDGPTHTHRHNPVLLREISSYLQA